MPEEVKMREDINLDKLLFVVDTLKDMAAEIVSETDLSLLVLRLLRLVMGSFGSTKGAIYIYNEPQSVLKSTQARGSEYKADLSINPLEAELLGKNTSAMGSKDFAQAYPKLHASNSGFPMIASTLLWVPLGVQGKLVGLIALGEKFLPGGYAEGEVSLLTMIGRQIAVSVNNHLLITRLNEKNGQLIQANQELDESNRRLDTLYKISQELNEQMQDTRLLLDTLIHRAMDQAKAQHGLLLYYDEDRQVLFPGPECQYNLKLPSDFIIKLDTQLGKALLAARPASEEGDLQKEYGLPGRHLLGVPMRTRDRSLGMLCLLDKAVRNGIGGFNERDVKLLTSLANQAATTLDNARLYELATVDGLTKLYVRHYMDQRLQEEVKKARRFQKQLSLLMLDIDHFKRVNDTYKHETGDEVLRIVAQLIKRTVRKDIDIPARYGGEELTVIMPETEAQGAQQVAERIRSAVEEAELLGPKGEKVKVTISIGVANLPQHAQEARELLSKADGALYIAKNSGRNRVVVYQPSFDNQVPTTQK